MLQTEFRIDLPDWVNERLAESSGHYPTESARMQFVLGLARENIRQQSGGPFAAAVFDGDGVLVSAGINTVLAGNSSILHAEMLAIALAQKALGRYDISNGGSRHFTLVSSSQPCTMCLGAVCWSGLLHLICGADAEDARRIGFDEGPRIPDWRRSLEERCIRVTEGKLRHEAVEVLNLYLESGGEIYNSRGGALPGNA